MDFSKLSTKEIKRLSTAMQEAGINELEVQEGEARIRLRIGQETASVAAPVVQAVPTNQTKIAATPALVPSPASTLDAPMVGTFYQAPSPEADAFVSVGDAVKKGQTIGIIEAMKTMNHVAAEKDGTITEMLVADGTPVQFGTPLMALS